MIDDQGRPPSPLIIAVDEGKTPLFIYSNFIPSMLEKDLKCESVLSRAVN